MLHDEQKSDGISSNYISSINPNLVIRRGWTMRKIYTQRDWPNCKTEFFHTHRQKPVIQRKK